MAAEGIAEGAVVGRGILGSVGQNADILSAGGIERGPNRSHPAVHHVGGGDHMAAGLGQHHRLLLEDGHRFVVDNPAIRQQPVVAVGGVGVEGNITDDADCVTRFGSHRLHRPASEVLGIEGMAAVDGLVPRVDHRKQGNCRNAKGLGISGSLHHPIDRQPLDTGHGRYWFRLILLMDEQWPDEISRRQPGFSDHRPQPAMLAVSTKPGDRESP